METNRLRYFCAIAETGSLTKASEILGVSHSGLSKAISTLENETGLKLFKPQGRGLEITPQGTWFYKKAQEILKIESEISVGEKIESRNICIGLSEVLSVSCAGLIAKELAQPISIFETDIGQTESLILSGVMDFAFVFSPAPKPELDYLELGEIKFNSYGRADLLNSVPAEILPFVVPATPFDFNPLGYKSRDGWPSDVSRSTYFAVSAFSTALDLVRSGQAVVYMPNFLAALENQERTQNLMLVKVPEHRKAESKRKLFLVKTKKSDESKEAKKVAKVLRKLCCASSL